MKYINGSGVMWSWIIGVAFWPVTIHIASLLLPDGSARKTAGIVTLAMVMLLHLRKRQWTVRQRTNINNITLGLILSALFWILLLGGIVAAFVYGEPVLD